MTPNTPERDPHREALGAVLAWLEGDDELLCEIVGRYRLRGDELAFLFAVLRLIEFVRERDEFTEGVYRLALEMART